jgi:hypothetical protein
LEKKKMSSGQTCSRLVGEEKEKGEGSSSQQEQASREHPDQRRERAPSEEQGPPTLLFIHLHRWLLPACARHLKERRVLKILIICSEGVAKIR